MNKIKSVYSYIDSTVNVPSLSLYSPNIPLMVILELMLVKFSFNFGEKNNNRIEQLIDDIQHILFINYKETIPENNFNFIEIYLFVCSQ